MASQSHAAKRATTPGEPKWNRSMCSTVASNVNITNTAIVTESSTASSIASSVEEYGVANTSMQQASALTSLNGKPLIVLTADERNNDAQSQSKQDHMATTNSLHRHANATHASLLDDQADAAAASQAIHDVVIAVRTSRPLAPG
jgi:hypothetical protein